jgi:hypothetical protein
MSDPQATASACCLISPDNLPAMLIAAILVLIAATGFGQDFDFVFTEDGEPVVETQIDGSKVWLLVDTGSTTNVFDKKYCEENNWKTSKKRGTTYGIYQKREGIEYLDEIPPIVGFGSGCADVIVVDLAMRNNGAKLRVVGIIGAAYLKKREAILDFKNSRITLKD